MDEISEISQRDELETSHAAVVGEPQTDDENVASKDQPKPKSRKRLWTIIIVVLLLLLGIVGGIAYYLYSSQYITTDDAFIDGEIVRVAPQESGKLVGIAAVENQRVKTGDLLVKIDPSGPTAELELRKAQLDQAIAQVAQAKAQISQAEAQVEQAQSTYDGNVVTANNLRTQADRYLDLFKKSGTQAITKQAIDDATSQADQAQATADASKTQIDNAKAGVTAANATLTAANAQVEASKAQVATAQVSVDRLTISASIDGQIVQKDVNLGSYVQPGTQMMAIVPDELYVTANYKETQLSGIRIGAKVDLAIDAFPDIAFTGTVRSIQNGAGQAFQLLPPQNATGNYVKVVQRVPVRISIDSPSVLDYPIGPGMSVVPSIHVED